MLPFKEWKPIGEYFAAEIDGLKKFIYGSSEEDIAKKVDKLGNEHFPVLIGIIPSSSSTSRNMDDRSYQDICFFYVLEPIKDRDQGEEDAVWERTQTAIQKIEHLIMDSYESSPLLRGIRPESVHYDPEYGIWNGIGWSIGFSMDNDMILG